MKAFRIVVVVALLVLCIGAEGLSQDRKLDLGLRAGMNFASESGDVGQGVTTSSITTFGGGAFVEYWFMKNLSGQLNVLYNMKGAEYELTYFGTTYKETDKLGYISLPIMLKYAVVQQPGLGVYLMAGPEISFLTSADYEIEGGSSGSFTDEMESTEFSIDLGAGVEFPVGSVHLFGDLRYGFGLSKIHKEADSNVKNNVFYINVGVAFPIKLN